MPKARGVPPGVGGIHTIELGIKGPMVGCQGLRGLTGEKAQQGRRTLTRGAGMPQRWAQDPGGGGVLDAQRMGLGCPIVGRTMPKSTGYGAHGVRPVW